MFSELWEKPKISSPSASSSATVLKVTWYLPVNHLTHYSDIPGIVVPVLYIWYIWSCLAAYTGCRGDTSAIRKKYGILGFLIGFVTRTIQGYSCKIALKVTKLLAIKFIWPVLCLEIMGWLQRFKIAQTQVDGNQWLFRIHC